MSATAWVSAAEPDRQHQMVSWTRVSLSVTRLAMYAPVVVRESAPECSSHQFSIRTPALLCRLPDEGVLKVAYLE
jgi:hypothetical protein